jgi:hypothetical protein
MTTSSSFWAPYTNNQKGIGTNYEELICCYIMGPEGVSLGPRGFSRGLLNTSVFATES